MERIITNILTEDLKATSETLEKLLDFIIEFDSDWFVIMAKGNNRLSAFKRDSEFIPIDYQMKAQGVIITFVVENVEVYFTRANNLGLNIVEEPRDLPYGQRRMLVQDPSGILLDISSPTAQLDPKYAKG